ncbi:hypothetical protein R3P38DRAFT_3496972 [Favolaschia claudopus]|uniref:F-box domain-containing protein n=1 Tax=Favolaschia claudopus TaxID=2862362 RepID=A0AAW0C7G9_9AGAR
MASHSLPKVCDDCCCKRCSRRRNHQLVLPGNTAPKSSVNPTLFILDNDERDPFRAALTPLNIPELLNECLAYYHSSPGDLAAFALVARCWVAVAQLHLYRAPNPSSSSFRGGNFRLRANQLYQTLSTNADLCSMVRELTLNEHHIGDGLDKIATVQLTHLRTLSITLTELSTTWFLASAASGLM